MPDEGKRSSFLGTAGGILTGHHDYRPLVRPGSMASEAESEVDATEALSDQSAMSPGPMGLSPMSNGPPMLQKQTSLAEKVPPEWVVLLLGCALGLATGASVVLFNLAVHGIHELAWAGTPSEGAQWLRLQPISQTWHRILLIPVLGGIMVGMLHALSGIIEQSKPPPAPHRSNRIDWGAASRPVIKAIQAAVTLGTGSSLGPEGPSVDIGKAWAGGMAEILRNSRERRIALVAAGAAAGIASGFNAAVAGCFFAIETVLRPSSAENAPPLTTAMIILASVLSSTVSNVVLGEEPAFTVPEYELRSAAELPLYLLLGMVCGIISVILTRLIAWSTLVFDFLRDRVGIPAAVTPALGALCCGCIALQYPGVLYWGFSNVNEILHMREQASAPRPKLMTQLIAAKIVATSICRGSGLVGGVYAPSLFIGSAVGSVYGIFAGAFMNAAVPGHAEVAHEQAYALVGMAAMLAAVCGVPLTSVLLLFELTKDYRILLPLMGAVGLAYWVSSVANRKKPPGPSSSRSGGGGGRGQRYQALTTGGGGGSGEGAAGEGTRRTGDRVWQKERDGNLELCTVENGAMNPDAISDDQLMDEIKVSQAMAAKFVTVQANATVKEAVAAMLEGRQRCAMVVDENNLLEGIMTLSDIHTEAIRAAMAVANGEGDAFDVQSCLVASVCSGKVGDGGDESELVVCYPDMSLKMASRLMTPRGLHQLPVVTRGGKRWQDRGRKVVGIVDRDALRLACRAEAMKRAFALLPQPKEEKEEPIDAHGH